MNNPCSISWALWICETLYVKWDFCAEAEWASACWKSVRATGEQKYDWCRLGAAWRTRGEWVVMGCGSVRVCCGMLTLYPLQFGAPKGHWQVEGDEVLVVAHWHQEFKLHFSQHLWKKNKQAWVCLRTDMQILWQLTGPRVRWLKLSEDSGNRTDLLFKWVYWIWPPNKV